MGHKLICSLRKIYDIEHSYESLRGWTPSGIIAWVLESSEFQQHDDRFSKRIKLCVYTYRIIANDQQMHNKNCRPPIVWRISEKIPKKMEARDMISSILKNVN